MFSIGRSAFQAQQEKMATIQNNVSNSSTPGYSQQSVELTTGAAAYGSDAVRGVDVAETRSRQAPFMDARIVDLSEEQGFHEGRQAALKPVEAGLSTGDENDLLSRFNDFYQQARVLSGSPSSDIERRGFIQESERLAARIRTAGNTIQDQRGEIKTQLKDEVRNINNKLDEIAELNDQIASTNVREDHAGGMVDRRRVLVEEVSKQIGVQVVEKDQGQIQLTTQNGETLVLGDDANTLEMQTDNITDDYNQLDISIKETPGGPIPTETVSGKVGGQIEAHNQTLTDKLKQLDELAIDFTQRFNSQHKNGDDINGNNGANFFEIDNGGPLNADGVPSGPDQTGAARNMEVIISDPDEIATAGNGDPPGSNENIKALIDDKDFAFTPDGTFEDQLREINEDIGTAIGDSKREQEAIKKSIDQLTRVRDSKTGVSLEEQMIEMNKAQRAFQAATKVMRNGEEMFQTLLRVAE